MASGLATFHFCSEPLPWPLPMVLIPGPHVYSRLHSLPVPHMLSLARTPELGELSRLARLCVLERSGWAVSGLSGEQGSPGRRLVWALAPPHLIGTVATGPSLHYSFSESHGCAPFPQHQGVKGGGVRRGVLWAEWSRSGSGVLGRRERTGSVEERGTERRVAWGKGLGVPCP